MASKPKRRKIEFEATLVKGSSYRINNYRFTKEEPTLKVDFWTGKVLMSNDKFTIKEVENA